MDHSNKKHIVVLTGAGISAESGLKTFRDIDGLWMGYDIQEVATPKAFKKNPKLVLDFYNMRRKEIAASFPNSAHFGLASLEEKYHLSIVTQNIDDLHERAGSKNIMHLHGEIFKMRSSVNESLITEIRDDINLGDFATDGTQLRPAIVWFEEPVPLIEDASLIMATADIFILIGTSLQVYPAAGLIHYLKDEIPKYIIDKKIPSYSNLKNVIGIEKSATDGIAILLEILL
jgi:NAD-dependent deacetylase